MQTYEVELRAFISKTQYTNLLKKFGSLSKGEQDNARTYTFVTSDINIKVKNLISRKKAKITVKNGAEYRQDVKETELEIDPKNVLKAVELVKAITGFKQFIPSFQKRINFMINGIAVSVKNDTHWKYHVEAEILVKNKKEIPAAKKKLRKFFEGYGLKPESEKNLRKKINHYISKYGFKKI